MPGIEQARRHRTAHAAHSHESDHLSGPRLLFALLRSTGTGVLRFHEPIAGTAELQSTAEAPLMGTVVSTQRKLRIASAHCGSLRLCDPCDWL
jgi:hypothetical protein